MKTHSFNLKSITTVLILALIGLNLYTCFNLFKARIEANKDKQSLNEHEKKSSYYFASFKQLLEMNVPSAKQTEVKLGVYLNLNSCDQCSLETVHYIKEKFVESEVKYYVDSNSVDKVHELKLKESQITFVKRDKFFQSNSPFFFLVVDGCQLLKFSHENDFTEATDIYIHQVRDYIRLLKMSGNNFKISKL